jgi:hypothetical protein
MANPTAPPNSSKPTTAENVGGVYNANTPTLVDGQASALQLDVNGNLKTTSSGGGGGGGNVNITGINSITPALSNPLPVELSDGTNAFGIVGNPIFVQDEADGTPGAAAPAKALQIGGTDGTDLRALLTDNTGQLKVLVENTPAISGTVTANQGTAAANTAGWPVTAGGLAESTASWTNATSINTALQVNCAGYSTVIVTLSGSGAVTPGVVTFEVSDTTAFTVAYTIFAQPTTSQGASVSTFTLTTSNTAYSFSVAGWAAFRVRLSTAITGAGTESVGITLSAGENTVNIGSIGTIASVATASVRSNIAASALADNQANLNFFANTSNAAEPLAVGDWAYGGAFSGAASAALQGWSKMRAPTVFKTVQATASGNTAVWTPGSGNKFRLLKVFVEVTDNASLASGAVLTISFQDATTGMPIAFDVFVPTTAVTTVIGDGLEQELDLGGFGILSAAANNVLNVNLSAALASGNVRVIAMGTEE